MEKLNLIKYVTVLIVAVLIGTWGCNEPVYDFGFDGELSGRVIDNSGNPVSGDVKLATYSVHALGENDLVSMVMRIKGDGSYSNTKLYPQSYKVSLRGPFVGSITDTVVVDLTGGRNVEHNFTVTPFLTIPAPVISGSPASTSVTVNYTITGNAGNAPNLREIYVSTVSWPTRTTGSGMGYRTVNTTVATDQGTATITGLEPGRIYFVRIGARAAGQTLFNHSEQVSFTTPSN
jgi:hypothetical protein